MAKARKCDRCGKFYDIYTINGLQDDLAKISTITTGNLNSNNISRDLCPECMNEFIEWYKKGQEQEDEK